MAAQGRGRAERALLAAQVVAWTLAALFLLAHLLPIPPDARRQAASILLILAVSLATAGGISVAIRTSGRERALWAGLAVAWATFLLDPAQWLRTLWIQSVNTHGLVTFWVALVMALISVPLVTILLSDSSRLTPFRRIGDGLDAAAAVSAAGAAIVVALYGYAPPAGPAGFPRITLVIAALGALTPGVCAIMFKHGHWKHWYRYLASGLTIGGVGLVVAIVEISRGAYAVGSPSGLIADGPMFAGFVLCAMAATSRLFGVRAGRGGKAAAPTLTAWRVAGGSIAGVLGAPLLLVLTVQAVVPQERTGLTVATVLFLVFVAARGAVLAAELRADTAEAMTDRMTGLASRPQFRSIVTREAQRAIDGDVPLTMCVFDLPGLSALNAAHGRGAGDASLAAVASVIASRAFDAGLAARVGGDELALLLPSTDSDTARALCTAIGREIAAQDPALRLAIGVAELPRHTTDVDELERLARGAAYWSGSMGGEDVVVYDPLLVGVFDSTEHVALLERETHTKTVEALAAAVDARDRYTRDHSQNVAELARLLATALGIDAERAEMVHAAGLLHDVGKIGISDRILLKSAPLSPADWEQIREHPALGERILRNAVHPEILAWVRGHHERWDGTGYPDGLSGRRIPLEARILNVCDSYDAMRSDRPYRLGMPREDALDELRLLSGAQFDPEVVAAFIPLACGEDAGALHPGTMSWQPYMLLHPTLPSVVVELLEDGSFGTCLAINDAVTDVLGYSAEDMVGQQPARMAVLRRVGPNRTRPAPLTQELLDAGEIPITEREMTRKDGSAVTMEITYARVERGARRLLIVTGRPLYADAATRRAVERRARKLEALATTTRHLNERLPAEKILAMGARCAAELVEALQGAVGLVREDGSVEYRYAAPGQDAQQVVVEIEHRICETVLATDAPFVENAIGKDTAIEPRLARMGVSSIVAVPIMGRGGRPLGCLEAHNSLRSFFEEDVVLLRGLASAVAIALENARGNERIEAHRRKLLRQQETLRMLTAELAITEERERRAIASDLHDGVGQSLQMAKMMVARARASSDPSVVEASLRDADALLAGAIGDTRTLINTVSPPSLYDLGLEAALSTLVDGHREGSSARFDYIDDGSAKPIVPARRAVVYRIARELLLNAVKHSEASEIVVATSRSGNMLVVEVVDDGVGFDVETSGHSSYGLPSLRERVAGLGGRLQVDSSPGRGTVVRFRVPLDQGANQVHG